jgi:N-methylhydantoinase B
LRDIEELEPGDTIIMNDPYLGGSHLPDVTLFKPVYIDGELAFFAANRAHHVDVGGGAPGSFVANATSTRRAFACRRSSCTGAASSTTA